MKYGFLTTLIPHQYQSVVQECSKSNMQDAANVLQWNLIEGLTKNLQKEIKLFNVLPVGSFPQYYRKAFIKPSLFETQYCQKNQGIGFCNIKLVRNFWKVNGIVRALDKWCGEERDSKTLFMYTVSGPFMAAVAQIKRKYPELNVIAIIADLPEMSSLSSKKGRLQEWFSHFMSAVSYSKMGCVDAFVLLTEQMADYLHIDKPYVVIEGIASSEHNGSDKFLCAEKTILYTGTLHRVFGVQVLLEAFSCIQDSEYRLIICGVGDSEDIIRTYADKDSRICFKGQVSRETALELQRQATVLVNPRQNNEEFTKYSFPSKIMEYLASGVPVVCYKLDGIPEEYDEYLNYAQDNSPETLAEKLMEICELDSHSRVEMGKKGQEFVLKNKNAVVQTHKILDLLQENEDTWV